MIEFPCEAFRSWTLVFWETFDHCFDFSDCNWLVQNFYFSWFMLGRLSFSKNLSLSCRLFILLTYSCSYYSHDSLYFCVVFCNVFFTSNLLIWFFSLFFLMSLASGLSSFFYLLIEPAFSFINLCCCFLHFLFNYFCSDLYDLFPAADLGLFCSSFSSCFRCRLMLSVHCFSCFLR